MGYITRFLRCSPDDQMLISGLEGSLSLSLSLSLMVDNPAALPPSGVVALSEPDPDMTAMLSQAAENVGLMWNPPPRPDPSRMDKWFLVGVSLFLTAPTQPQQPSTRQCRGAGRRHDSQPVQAPAKPGSKHKCKRP